MAVVSGSPTPFQPGPRLIDGTDLNTALGADLTSFADGYTAGAGGTLLVATLVTAALNRVTTVASPGDSIRLPAANAGANVFVDNDGANYLTVFPSGTDTIEDVTTGQILLAGDAFQFICTATGKWYIGGNLGTSDAFTALGTNQATAAQIVTDYTNITIAAANTGVKLPPADAGTVCVIFVSGTGNNIKVYGNGTDTIDGTAGATGVTLSDTKRCEYICFTNGKWISAQLGVTSA